jgi:hypothetical protein
MAADRMWRFVERLHLYDGAVTAALRESTEEITTVSAAPDCIPATPISPQAAEGLLRNPLYGPIPGLGPAFSVSYAPLADNPEVVSDGGGR